MGQRVIPVAVTAEYIGGDGVTLGAAGSHNSVLIEYDFRSAGPQWDDISGRYVLWTNPQGNSTNRINLGVSEKVEGYEGVYQAAPPADAMCVPGWAEMVVVGFTLDGDKEITKIKTEPSRFRVLPGSSRASDNEGIAATVADQLQAEIEAVERRKVNKPVSPYDPSGEVGQILESLGGGRTRWRDETVASKDTVEEVLREHPEWVTTVADRSIGEDKLADEILNGMEDIAYYSEVESSKIRYCDTDCYVVKVPETDAEGNAIDIHLERDTERSPMVHARETETTVTTNACIVLQRTDDTYVRGNLRGDGEWLVEQEITSEDRLKSNQPGYILISKEGRNVMTVGITTTRDALESYGDAAWTVMTYYWTLVRNGALVDNSETTANENGVVSGRHPRLAIGIRADKTVVLFACDGRTTTDLGLTSDELAQIMLNYGCVDAWNLDGGGSTSVTVRGEKVNRNWDDNETKDRGNAMTLNVRKQNPPGTLTDIYNHVGKVKQALIEMIMPRLRSPFFPTKYDKDLDAVKSFFVGYVTHAVNGPPGYPNGSVVCIPNDDGTNGVQYFAAVPSGLLFCRRLYNGAWGDYVRIDTGVPASGELAIPDDSHYCGLVLTEKVYVTIPLSTVVSATANSARVNWGEGGGLILRQNGHFIAGTDQSPLVPQTTEIRRIGRYTGLQIVFFSDAVAQDAAVTSSDVISIQIKGLTITFDGEGS